MATMRKDKAVENCIDGMKGTILRKLYSLKTLTVWSCSGLLARLLPSFANATFVATKGL